MNLIQKLILSSLLVGSSAFAQADFTFNGFQVTGNVGITNYVAALMFGTNVAMGTVTIQGDLVQYQAANRAFNINAGNSPAMQFRPRIVTNVVATTVLPRHVGDWMVDVAITGVYFAIGATTNDWRLK